MSQNVSFISNQSKKSQLPHQHIKKKQKIEPYISPFILNAKKIADERAKKALRILKEGRSTPVVNEWDQNTRTPGLFDPNLKKQEIFRIEPRHRVGGGGGSSFSSRGKENQEEENQRHFRQQQQNNLLESPTSIARVERIGGNNKITMKTTGIAPKRVPQSYRVNPNLVRATRPLHFPNERSKSPPQQNHTLEITNSRPTLVSEGTDAFPADFEDPSRGREKSRRSISPKQGDKVTRSTSPIDEIIVNKILTAEEKKQTLKKKSILEDVLHEKFQAGKGDHNQYYGDLIRERLQMILNRHRRAPPPAAYRRHPQSTAADDSDDEEFEHPAYYRPSRYYYPPNAPPSLDPNQIYTRDMMASMATIMSAVGDILVKKSNNNYWENRRSSRRSKSAPPTQTVDEASSDVLKTAKEEENQQLTYPNTATSQQNPGAEASQFMKDMSKAIFEKEGLPKSKSVVVDMIMQKLHAIEKAEKEIAEYLKKDSDQDRDQDRDRDRVNLQEEEEPRSHPPPSPSKLAHVSSPVSQINHPSQQSSASLYGETPLTVAKIERKHRQQDEELLKKQDITVCFPKLHSVGCDQLDAIQDYIKDLQYAQKLQNAIYERKDTTLAITVDTISDVLFDRLVFSVANEVEHVIDDYAHKVIQQI